MPSQSLTLINPLGLHARAASKLVALSQTFACELLIEKDGKQVDAKSIMGLLTLGAPVGSELILHADGEDDQQAIDAITDLIQRGFDELEPE